MEPITIDELKQKQIWGCWHYEKKEKINRQKFRSLHPESIPARTTVIPET